MVFSKICLTKRFKYSNEITFFCYFIIILVGIVNFMLKVYSQPKKNKDP